MVPSVTAFKLCWKINENKKQYSSACRLSVLFSPVRLVEKAELRWWGKLPEFSLSNLSAETGKETKGITFLAFLRQGLHQLNNEEFWKIRSRAHTSCRLSSKCIFWLNFLCTDFFITDTYYSSALSVAGAVKECCLQCFSPASLHIKGSSAPQNKLGKHRQDRRLWKSLWDRSSPPVILWAYTSCPKQYSHREKGCQVSALSCMQSRKNTAFLAKPQASLSLLSA